MTKKKPLYSLTVELSYFLEWSSRDERVISLYEQKVLYEICKRKGTADILMYARTLYCEHIDNLSDVHTLDQLNCFLEEPSGDETVLSFCE